jgi:hypothetical protein
VATSRVQPGRLRGTRQGGGHGGYLQRPGGVTPVCSVSRRSRSDRDDAQYCGGEVTSATRSPRNSDLLWLRRPASQFLRNGLRHEFHDGRVGTHTVQLQVSMQSLRYASCKLRPDRLFVLRHRSCPAFTPQWIPVPRRAMREQGISEKTLQPPSVNSCPRGVPSPPCARWKGPLFALPRGSRQSRPRSVPPVGKLRTRLPPCSGDDTMGSK